MLENENFDWDGYVDIFDGGPTVTARTDKIKTVMDADWIRVAGISEDAGSPMLVATGVLHDFVACYAQGKRTDNGELLIDHKAMEMLNIGAGDRVLMVGRSS